MGFLTDYLLYFALFLVSLLLVTFVSGHNMRSLGFRPQSVGRVLAWGIAGGIAAYVLVMLSGYLVQLFSPPLKPQPFEDVLRQVTGSGEFIAMLVVGSVLAPLTEEMYFRGMVYSYFRRYLGITWSIIISGMIFGLFHWDGWRFLPLALGGMVLASLFEKSRTIYTSWIAHGVWNAIMASIVFFLKS
jgi:membrane protease YdiL (CAAX protease family)